MINFPDIHDEWYEFYDPHGNYIDRIEDYIQWLHVLVQIKEQNLNGYYIVSREGVKMEINDKARYDYKILDPYAIVGDLCFKILKPRVKL